MAPGLTQYYSKLLINDQRKPVYLCCNDVCHWLYQKLTKWQFLVQPVISVSMWVTLLSKIHFKNKCVSHLKVKLGCNTKGCVLGSLSNIDFKVMPPQCLQTQGIHTQSMQVFKSWIYNGLNCCWKAVLCWSMKYVVLRQCLLCIGRVMTKFGFHICMELALWDKRPIFNLSKTLFMFTIKKITQVLHNQLTVLHSYWCAGLSAQRCNDTYRFTVEYWHHSFLSI